MFGGGWLSDWLVISTRAECIECGGGCGGGGGGILWYHHLRGIFVCVSLWNGGVLSPY